MASPSSGAKLQFCSQQVSPFCKLGSGSLERAILKDRAPTTVGPNITIDYAKSILTVEEKSFPFPPLSPAAQQLIVAGGAESQVAGRLRKE
jgi:hypothetical protein